VDKDDNVFNVDKQQQDFFKSLLNKYNIQTVLDISQGYENLAFLMAKWGKDVTFLEDNVLFAQKAHLKSIQSGIKLRILSADMRDLSSVCQTKFDLITCINNTLFSLPNEEDVWGTLAQMYLKLHPGGLLVIYDVEERKEVAGSFSSKDLHIWLAELGFEKIENFNSVWKEKESNFLVISVTARPQTSF